MALPILAIIQLVIDLIVILAMVAAIIAIAGIIKDILADNLVDILVDMPSFDYSFQDGAESGGTLFETYKQHRDMVVWPLILIGSLAWLVTGRFGHRVRASIAPERTKPETSGVPGFMRPNSPLLARGDSPVVDVDMGSDPRGGGWFTQWLSGLPSKCVLFLVLLFLLPPLWDAAMDGSAWAANTILNPVYSGDDAYPCPRDWYVMGALDMSNPELLAHHKSVQYLLMQDKTGSLDAMCRPELRVRYMLEQWGGETKAIPPPLEGGSPWEMVTQMWDNAGDWMMRGLGEFFINTVLGIVKAQAIIMSGTSMIVSNVLVDVAVATMIVFAPLYFLLMLVPWERVHGGAVLNVLKQYTPAVLAAAIIYPIEVAVLFAVSSNLLVQLLLSDHGNNLVVVWLFGTAIMSMVVALPIVTMGAFAQLIENVTGRFTAMIQAAQGGLGMAAGRLGGMSGISGGVTGSAMGKAGGAGAAGGAMGGAAGKAGGTMRTVKPGGK